MYVIDAIGKGPYEDFPHLPPYRGARNPPVQPGRDGHFDHLGDPWSREFMAAHMYGTLRFVLDVWERYFGAPIPWHFARDLPRLELVPLVEWDNAHSGYGFIETGFARPGAPDPQPFCLNFDVLAHELGHSFIYALLGTPPPDRVSAEFLAFHESAADCVAMMAVLDFDSVVDRLLERTRGNIYLPNELNRIGELSETEQIRLASQSLTLADVPDLRTPPSQLSQPQRHAMSLPLTGAVFDVLVEVFQEILVRDGLISRELDDLSRQEEGVPEEIVQSRIRSRLCRPARGIQGRPARCERLRGQVPRHRLAQPVVECYLWRGGRRAARRGRAAYRRRRPEDHAGEPALARHRVPVSSRAGCIPRARGMGEAETMVTRPYGRGQPRTPGVSIV